MSCLVRSHFGSSFDSNLKIHRNEIYQGMARDNVAAVASHILAPIEELEDQWDLERLATSVAWYFHNAAKNLDARKPWSVLLTDFTEKALASLFQGLAGRSWFRQVDFTPILEACFLESLPECVVSEIPQDAFSSLLAEKYAHVYEQQRQRHVLWEVILHSDINCSEHQFHDITFQSFRSCLAYKEEEEGVGDFVKGWILEVVIQCHRQLQQPIAEAEFSAFFHETIKQGMLPASLTQERGQTPEGWIRQLIDVAVQEARKEALLKPRPPPGPPPAALLQGKGGGKDKGKDKGKGVGKDTGKGKPHGRGKPAPRPRHPKCIQGIDCIGHSEMLVYRHMDDNVSGDLYCDACWGSFFEQDGTLQARLVTQDES